MLVERLRRGESDASYRFFRDYYPGVYRYLLWLTGRPELAEDLAQETFLRAWRSLHTFDERGSLRPWLHRIAHREFLQALRSQRHPVSLEAIAEVPAPGAAERMEAVELREVLRTLPVEEREVMMLHYLEGYTSAEIAQIVRAPAGTVRYRMTMARARLQQELGEGDLTYWNEQTVARRQWAWLPLEQMHALEARLSLSVHGEEYTGVYVARAEGGGNSTMEADRQREKEIVDPRLAARVTLAVKGMALSDLCEQLRSDTGVHLTAGASVTDEKVTLFCEKLPLRAVMRQLSRPFGYTWLRSRVPARGAETSGHSEATGAGAQGEYKYELVQDLRSQLLEEELRNRDRNEAFLALDREMERYRPYLGLSSDEALARAETAPADEKRLLEALGKTGWGPIQIYFRLSRQDQEALRAGQWLVFSEEPRTGEQRLPPDLARGVLQSIRETRVFKTDHGFAGTSDLSDPRGVALAAAAEARAQIKLGMPQAELGEFAFHGLAGWFTPRNLADSNSIFTANTGPIASGRSPALLRPEDGAVNAGLARDRAFRPRISLEPQPSCGLDLSSSPSPKREGEQLPLPASGDRSGATPGAGGEVNAPKVTTADVLEALHRATGLPIVADYYTRLYEPETVSVRNLPLFDALNRLAAAMRLRWTRDEDGNWLQFRSSSFFNDRLKEVPNRLLARWSTARRQHGVLTLDDLVEIAQLPDAQLDAEDMMEGARECWGLAEWQLARNGATRPHLRFLAELSPAQRQETLSAVGLPFTRMSLAQQQRFVSVALGGQPLQSLEELGGATLRVDYTQPGWFQWGDPGGYSSLRWVIPLEPGPQGKRVLRPPVRERTREATVQTIRRVDPQIREALLQAMRRSDPRLEAAPPDDEAQVFPTKLSLAIVYIPGASNARPIYMLTEGSDLFLGG